MLGESGVPELRGNLMNAMVLDAIAPIGSSPLNLTEMPPPEPQAGQVRVKVRACAICRTDLHVIEGDLPRATLPIIPGHQIVGTVDALGPGCERLEPCRRVDGGWHRCGNGSSYGTVRAADLAAVRRRATLGSRRS